MEPPEASFDPETKSSIPQGEIQPANDAVNTGVSPALPENNMVVVGIKAEETPGSSQVTKNHAWQVLREIVETFVLAGVLFLVINLLTARIRVDGASMEPTLYTGEFVLVNRLAYKLALPQRGDIVVFDLPRQPTRDYIKRIIGLPGDRVEVKNRQVYVNGQALQEPYIAEMPAYTGTWVVPADSVFALGDNRNNSTDSHNWGAIPLEHIVGRASVIYWPPQRWDIINSIKIMP